MQGNDYLIAQVVIAGTFSGLAVAANRRAGLPGLARMTGIAVAAIFLLGYLDWQRLPSKETPLEAYALVALLPTLVAALAVHVTSRWTAIGQWLAGAITCFVVFFPTLVLGMILS